MCCKKNDYSLYQSGNFVSALKENYGKLSKFGAEPFRQLCYSSCDRCNDLNYLKIYFI